MNGISNVPKAVRMQITLTITAIFCFLGNAEAYAPPIPVPFEESNNYKSTIEILSTPAYDYQGEHKEALSLLGAVRRLHSPNSPQREIQDYQIAIKSATELKAKIDAGHPSKLEYLRALAQATILIPAKYSTEFCRLVAGYFLKTPEVVSTLFPILNSKEKNAFSRRLWVGCRQVAVESQDNPDFQKKQDTIFETIRVYL